MTSRNPSPICRPRGRRYLGLVAAAVPLIIGLGACSAPSPAVTPETAGSVSKSPAPAAKTSTVPSPEISGQSPSGSATAAPSGVSSAVEGALRTLLTSTPQPSREQIQASLSAAGVAPATVEVSASRTPTGLAADAVDVGVVGDLGCVMAQVRAGTVAMSVLPVLANGRCFVGSVQR